MKGKDPLDKLANLTKPVSQIPHREPSDSGDNDEAYQKHMEKSVEQLLTYAQKLMGAEQADIFEVQELVEAAAEQIRFDIRDMAGGDEDDE